MYAEISAAIQSVKTIGEIAKTANSLANHTELVSAVADVNTKLMDAIAVALASQERQSELLSRVVQLEKEIAELKNKQTQAERYQLHKFPTSALAYQLKEPFETEEPSHFLCAKCFDTGSHTKLQPYSSRRLKCFSCETVIQSEYDPPPSPRRNRGAFY